MRRELACGDKTYSVTLAPVLDRRHVDLYALTIAGRKLAEEVSERNQLFLQMVLDSFSGNVVVLNNEGRIVMAKKLWKRVIRKDDVVADFVFAGRDYLAVCRQTTGNWSRGTGPAADGVEQVLQGEQPHFEMEYLWHSPGHRRWFQMLQPPRTGDSTGIGLVIAERIVELHGRKIWVESQLGNDDDLDVMIVECCFKDLGIDVEVVHRRDREEALTYLRGTTSLLSCLILLDVNMPRMEASSPSVWSRQTIR